MKIIIILLGTALFPVLAKATGLSNYNLARVDNSPWTTDFIRDQSNRGPM